MGRVLTVLDDAHRSATGGKLQLKLVEGGEIHVQNLVVTKEGTDTSYPLPGGQGSECVSGPVTKALGRGLEVRMTTSPEGPRAELFGPASGDTAWRTLTRKNPALPASEGEVRILNASSAEPLLEWHVQNGAPVGHASFPKLHPGCTFNYTLQKPTRTPLPETAPSDEPVTKPSATPSTPAAPKPQTAGQTSVVPKGGVAAGAEVAASEESAGSTTALGAALAAVLAGVGTAFALRRRARATQR
ncbi:hypothetical protein [Streptomyces sp. NPDC006463]|uniref:hypothetical protein n=1 Tax=Streptomyces sp. NPDC006463 TaxID=3364746 RepID=UPI0036AE2007